MMLCLFFYIEKKKKKKWEKKINPCLEYWVITNTYGNLLSCLRGPEEYICYKPLDNNRAQSS